MYLLNNLQFTHLNSSHEKTDTKIILHAVSANQGVQLKFHYL